MSQALPRNIFEILVSSLGDRSKAEVFAGGIETIVSEQGKSFKSEIKEELRNELITRELFLVHAQMVEDKFKMVDEKFKIVDWKINILIALVILFGTFLNPTFLSFLSRLMGI